METPTGQPQAVHMFETSGGARIFQIPLQEFPILWGYAYLVWVDGPGNESYRVLIDAGSGFGESNHDLEEGFHQTSLILGRPVGFGDLTHVFITHGHIDHFGGLSYVRPLTQARIGVHELDLRNLTNYEERLLVVSRRLDSFLTEAGVPAERRRELIDLYNFSKSLYHSTRVDFTYEAVGMQVGPFEFLHVPGHCAGHVCIRLHDVLFSGDHVLSELSPHQSPESLTSFTGLAHYLKSLDALQAWAGDIHLILGGHRTPIRDLGSRLVELRRMHQVRLDRALEYLAQPHTIADVSQELFGEVHGYNVLLAFEEAGAHVEYLAQRGRLRIANLDDLQCSPGSVAIRYQVIDENIEIAGRNGDKGV